MLVFLHRTKKIRNFIKCFNVEYFSYMKATFLFLFNPPKLAIIVIDDY